MKIKPLTEKNNYIYLELLHKTQHNQYLYREQNSMVRRKAERRKSCNQNGNAWNDGFARRQNLPFILSPGLHARTEEWLHWPDHSCANGPKFLISCIEASDSKNRTSNCFTITTETGISRMHGWVKPTNLIRQKYPPVVFY